MTEKEFLEIKTKLNAYHKPRFLENRSIYMDEILEIIEKFVKPKPEFKVGDKVVIYDNSNKSIGIIKKIKKDILTIQEYAEFQAGGFAQFYHTVHKKQCRRLKKKEK